MPRCGSAKRARFWMIRAGYRFTVGPPAGQDRIFVLAERRQLALRRLGALSRGQVSVRGADDFGRSLAIELQPLPQADWVTDVAFFRMMTGSGITPGPGTGEHAGTLAYQCSASGRPYTIDAVYSPGGASVRLTTPGRRLQMARIVYRPQTRYAEYSDGQFKWVTVANRPVLRRHTGLVSDRIGEGALMHVFRHRTAIMIVAAALAAVQIVLPGSALAEVGDISVGGI